MLLRFLPQCLCQNTYKVFSNMKSKFLWPWLQIAGYMLYLLHYRLSIDTKCCAVSRFSTGCLPIYFALWICFEGLSRSNKWIQFINFKGTYEVKDKLERKLTLFLNNFEIAYGGSCKNQAFSVLRNNTHEKQSYLLIVSKWGPNENSLSTVDTL